MWYVRPAKAQTSHARLSLELSKCHIVGNHISRLNYNTQLGAKSLRLPRCSPSAIASGVHQS